MVSALALASSILLPLDPWILPAQGGSWVGLDLQGRSGVVRGGPTLSWQQTIGPLRLHVLDSGFLRVDPSPITAGTDHSLRTGLFWNLPADWEAQGLLHLAARAENFLGPDPAAASSGERIQGGLRLVHRSHQWAMAVAGGGLHERADPGSLSPGWSSRRPPPDGTAASAWWSAEAAARTTEENLRIGTSARGTTGSAALRDEEWSLEGSFRTSWKILDTITVGARFDSTRRRSLHLLEDLSTSNRGASGRLRLQSHGRHLLQGGLEAARADRRDLALRRADVRDERLAGFASWSDSRPEPTGLSHGHHIEVVWTRRFHDPWARLISSGFEDARDNYWSRRVSLRDSLAWWPGTRRGLGLELTSLQTRDEVRHPLNRDPLPGDRPDADLVEAQWEARLRWPLWERPGRALLRVRREDRDEVRLKSVHSSLTRRSTGWITELHGTPLGDSLWRFESGLAVRELVTRFRFDPGRSVGLLETSLEGVFTVGARGSPRVTARTLATWVRSGSLEPRDDGTEVFGVRLRALRLEPEVRTYWRPARFWMLEGAWGGRQENAREWDGSRYTRQPLDVSWLLEGVVRHESSQSGIDATIRRRGGDGVDRHPWEGHLTAWRNL